MPGPDGYYDGPLPASKTSLLDVLEDIGTKTIHYIYDFGDNWHHVVKVEKIDDATPAFGECLRFRRDRQRACVHRFSELVQVC